MTKQFFASGGIGPNPMLTSYAEEIFVFAREEAIRLGNDTIRPEHLMLAIIRQYGYVCQVLKNHGVDLYELRKEIENFMKKDK